MKRLLLVACVMLSLACAAAQKPADAPAATSAAAPASSAVAVVNGITITEKELEDRLGNALVVKRQEEYALKREALDDLIFLKLQEQAAQKEGTTAEALYKKKVLDAVQEPTDEQVDAFYTQNKARLNPNEADAKQQVRDYLRGQAAAEKEQAFRAELLAASKIEVKMRPPRLEIPRGTAPLRGPEKAPVTIVEFTDYQCPYCSRVQPTLERIFTEYKDQVNLVFKDFPLDFHKDARGAHNAALCAADQNKFWEFHDIVFKNQQKIGIDDLKKYGADLGLDTEKFNACIDQRAHEKTVAANVQLGQTLGVTGTPCFFVNGRVLKGAVPFEQFKALIDEELSFAATARPGN
jgi:protein-disulfide isomerase